MRYSRADLAAFRHALGGLQTRRNLALWGRDPVAWLSDRIGEHCWSKQAEILHSVAENSRTAVQSCHGIGKSWVASRAGLWYIDTARHVGDRFLVTTAPTSAQVKAVLWRYIRQGHTAGNLPGRIMQTAEWKVPAPGGDELVGYGRKPADWQASAFQGIHAPEGVMVILDEACGVAKQLFVDADALGTTDMSRTLAIGNPDDNGSHFHTVCTTEPGWYRIKVSAFDTPAFTGEPVNEVMAKALVQRSWVEDKRLRWGESNPLYVAKVLGEFADAADGLIPLSWVRAAIARWHAWAEQNSRERVRVEPPGRRIYGVDVAWLGEDHTAIVTRQGDIVLEVEQHAKEDTVTTAARVQAKLNGHPRSHAIVDVVGVGAGVFDQLRRTGHSVQAFNAGKPTRRRDSSGEWRFNKVRSAAWYNLRDLLDPARGATLALPDNDELTADLTAPKYEPRTGGVIHVEEKDEIRKRLGHSPDAGDALAISCWTDIEDPADADTVDEPTPVPYQALVEAGLEPRAAARERQQEAAIEAFGADPDDYL